MRSWMEDLPPFVDSVGVFVDEKVSQVKKISELCRLTCIQLHGHETPDYCSEFPKERVIKAIRIQKGFKPAAIKPYLPYISGILLDSPRSGERFDWNIARLVREAYADLPLILAGGITADTVDEAVRIVQPYAIDVSSSVETSPGVKDPQKVQDLIQRLHDHPSFIP